MFRPQEISATDARKYLSQIINKVQFGSKSFVVKAYRRPAVRIVKEQYIAALEQVLGKKTVGQVLEISANDNLPEFAKVEQIKKIFQRRLSGQPQPKPQPKSPAPAPKQKPAPPHTQNPKPNPSPKPKHPHPRTSHLKPPTSKSREVLLLSNGKNYQ